MIHLPPAACAALPHEERWALDLLVDLARLLPVDDPAADVVSLHPVGPAPVAGGAIDAELRAARAAAWGIAAAGDGRVACERATLALVARIAGLADERRSAAADRHGRVPSAENALVRTGTEREPVVHEAAVALRAAVVRAAGDRPVRLLAPWPDGRRWAAAFTHDLDVVAAWPAFAALRWVELAGKRELAIAARAVAAAARHALGDPVGDGVRAVLDLAGDAAVRATWFVLCGTPTAATFRRGDLTYRPESPAARRLLAAIGSAGHEIGLHGSFATFDHAGALVAERARLAALVGQPVSGIRQHFLRLRPGRTHDVMRRAGFAYDATLGFPDRNGFRLGVADVLPSLAPVPPTTAAGEAIAAVDLPLVPLVWMDRALSKYRGVERPDAWVDDALELAGRCAAVEGLWTGLWHPNLTAPLGYPDALPAYARLVGAIVTGAGQGVPHVAPLADLVAWRQARRSVRLRTLPAPEGGPVVRDAVDPRIVVEDVDGRPDDASTASLHAGR